MTLPANAGAGERWRREFRRLALVHILGAFGHQVADHTRREVGAGLATRRQYAQRFAVLIFQRRTVRAQQPEDFLVAGAASGPQRAADVPLQKLSRAALCDELFELRDGVVAPLFAETRPSDLSELIARPSLFLGIAAWV